VSRDVDRLVKQNRITAKSPEGSKRQSPDKALRRRSTAPGRDRLSRFVATNLTVMAATVNYAIAQNYVV